MQKIKVNSNHKKVVLLSSTTFLMLKMKFSIGFVKGLIREKRDGINI